MDAVSLLRQTFGFTHQYFEGTVEGVDADLATAEPGGRVSSIAAQYAHVVAAEDAVIQGIAAGRAPLMASSWAERTGWSAPPPLDGPFDAWARTATLDLAQLREYGHAVYDATDAYLAELTDADLDRPLDLTEAGLGHQTVGSLLAMFACHVTMHCGEISALKGLRGLQGYPS